MYHNVSSGGRKSRATRAAFDVPRSAFETQLDVVSDLGLRGSTLGGVLHGEQGMVAITFDDGDAGQFEYAFRALCARGMTATFFVTTSWVGTSGFVSWQQLCEMKAAGMAVQSHTHRHPFLVELDEVEVRNELFISKSILDEKLEQNTDQVSLPNGDWPKRSLRPLLMESGYRVVGTSEWGPNRGMASTRGSPLAVRRCTVQGELQLDVFRAVVLADPWVTFRRRVRDRVLRSLRGLMGPTAYGRTRRSVLELLERGASPPSPRP